MRRIAIACLAVLALAACGPDKGGKAGAGAGAAKSFMTENAKKPGVVSLPSGLQYKVVRSGPADGLRPKVSDEVMVHYEGKLVSGEVFDSSYERGTPMPMGLEGIIPGWVEALQLMRPGDEWTLYIPPALGYGEQGSPPAIPPNSPLIFRIELLGVYPHPGR